MFGMEYYSWSHLNLHAVEYYSVILHSLYRLDPEISHA
jgi:hypothetical protein